MSKLKNDKIVNKAQCVWAIIFCIITIATIFVPYMISSEVKLTFTALPLIGDGNIMKILNNQVFGLTSLFNVSGLVISTSLLETISTVVQIVCIYGFYGIVIFHLLFSILVLATRVNAIRVIGKVFSIILGIVMIFIFLIQIAVLILLIVNCISADGFYYLLDNGIIYFIVLTIFSFAMIIQQFKWYSYY